jgi:hypothetical protein
MTRRGLLGTQAGAKAERGSERHPFLGRSAALSVIGSKLPTNSNFRQPARDNFQLARQNDLGMI